MENSHNTVYKMSQIAENNGKNGNKVWLVIKNNVYDVTDYVEEHPGGADLILEEAGKDATKPFNNAGHSTDARNILKKYQIGILSEEGRPSKKENQNKAKTETDIANARSFISILSCGCLA